LREPHLLSAIKRVYIKSLVRRGEGLFSRKMSLKRDWILIQDEPKGGGIGMLGIDHQHGRFGSSLEQIRGFLAGSGEVPFRAEAGRGVPLGGTDVGAARVRQSRAGEQRIGAARQYMARMTGLSRAQVTRLIAGHRQTGRAKATE
jgi:hypothetical protein